MPAKSNADMLKSEVSGDYIKDTETLKAIFYYPDNEDAIFREVYGCGFEMCVVFIDGMIKADSVDDFILRAVQHNAGSPAPTERVGYMMKNALSIAQVTSEKRMSKIAEMILSGMTAVLAEGMDEAILLDTRGFDRRQVNQTTNESVVMGSQEGFVENLRTNLTLMHRYVQSAEMMCEMLTVGTKTPLRIALVYMKEITNKTALESVRRRIKTVDRAVVHGLGQLEQLIEDSPWAIMPQMLMTERPDRTAAALSDGQFVILADSSPYALIAPCDVFALLQASDDAFSRWQYGTYTRIVRWMGILFALLLPGIYVALTMYHAHLIPMSLLSSIAETRVNVPFPVLVEMAILELAFFLINEANMRIPSQIGSSIGIIGALVLGQAAVEASLISPILIIIIALSGLGCYAVPNHSVSISLIIYRLALEALGGVLGLLGIALGVFLILCQISSLRSFGMDFISPVAPHSAHNPDIIWRLPIFMQRKRSIFRERKGRGAL